MLQAVMQASLPRAMPRELMGPLRGTKAEIEALQTALKNLAIATQRPDIDPGIVDGVVGTKTVTSIIAAQTLLSKELPQWAFLSLQAALAAGAMTSVAKQGIEAAAVPLTVAANTAAVKYKANPLMPTAADPFAFFKTPLGIGVVLVGLFIGYKLFFSTPTKAA